MKQDEITGKPIGVAWKNFGYKGPKFHDGFLYGELTSKLEMTGILQLISDLIDQKWALYFGVPPFWCTPKLSTDTVKQ